MSFLDTLKRMGLWYLNVLKSAFRDNPIGLGVFIAFLVIFVVLMEIAPAFRTHVDYYQKNGDWWYQAHAIVMIASLANVIIFLLDSMSENRIKNRWFSELWMTFCGAIFFLSWVRYLQLYLPNWPVKYQWMSLGGAAVCLVGLFRFHRRTKEAESIRKEYERRKR